MEGRSGLIFWVNLIESFNPIIVSWVNHSTRTIWYTNLVSLVLLIQGEVVGEDEGELAEKIIGYSTIDVGTKTCGTGRVTLNFQGVVTEVCPVIL